MLRSIEKKENDIEKFYNTSEKPKTGGWGWGVQGLTEARYAEHCDTWRHLSFLLNLARSVLFTFCNFHTITQTADLLSDLFVHHCMQGRAQEFYGETNLSPQSIHPVNY